MSNLYVQLDYEGYKLLEQAMKAFNETVHKSVTGYYHKSIRLPVGKDMTIEFHGPVVNAEER